MFLYQGGQFRVLVVDLRFIFARDACGLFWGLVRSFSQISLFNILSLLVSGIVSGTLSQLKLQDLPLPKLFKAGVGLLDTQYGSLCLQR